jgi:alcohol dehydrogenase class IV
VGDINQSINQVQNSGSQEMAEILGKISNAILSDSRLKPQDQQEAIENIRTLAQEAGLPSTNRKLGIVKATLAYIPSLLSASTDILNYFQVHLEDIRRFFGI